MYKIKYKVALLSLFSLVLFSCGNSDAPAPVPVPVSGTLELDSSFQGSWERQDLRDGRCEAVSFIVGGQNFPDSHNAVYVIQGNQVEYVWNKHTADLTCSTLPSYSDIMTLKVIGISEASGITTVTTSVIAKKRTVHNAAGTTYLNSAGGNCGVSSWPSSFDYEYNTNGFLCTEPRNRRFEFADAFANIGATLYFTMKKNGVNLELQLSDDLNSMGPVQSLDSL